MLVPIGSLSETLSVGLSTLPDGRRFPESELFLLDGTPVIRPEETRDISPTGRYIPAMPRQDAFLDHLATVPLFSALSNKDLQLVARRAEDVSVPAGKEIVRQGESGHEFFAIVEGTATVTRDGRTVATLGPGGSFGELALLGKAPRNATVTADTPMELFVLGNREFAGIIDDVPGFARKLLTALASRLRESDAQSVH